MGVYRTRKNEKLVFLGQVEEYELPYFDCVPSDPSFDEMKDAVCVREMRPCLSERWHTNEVFIF